MNTGPKVDLLKGRNRNTNYMKINTSAVIPTRAASFLRLKSLAKQIGLNVSRTKERPNISKTIRRDGIAPVR